MRMEKSQRSSTGVTTLISARIRPPGHGQLAALKDLAVARCSGQGRRSENRLVKGYVGMLEVGDTLHETATYTIPLQKSAAVCARLSGYLLKFEFV